MLKKTIATLLFSMSSILFISINCFGGLPDPDMCVKCHGFDIYDEWSESKHGNIVPVTRCWDCHISGKAQDDFLEPGEKQGFHILGYHDGATWQRPSSPKEVCLRCHDGLDDYIPVCKFKQSGPVRADRDCHECHMPVDGLKTYRLHKWPLDDGEVAINLDNYNNNIVKYVTREHRNHKFPNLKKKTD